MYMTPERTRARGRPRLFMESISLMSDYHGSNGDCHDNKRSISEEVSTDVELGLDGAADDVGAQEEEKKFLRRLDWILITYVWTSYCIKQIDSSNYKTAYVSGMKEDLSLHGNELNYFDSLFRIGYAVSIIPSSLLLSYYRPSILLPSLELVWGIMTGLIAFAKSPPLIYAARFIIGVCEASSYPGTVTILMNWYTPSELSTRVSLFSTSYPAANIFVGSLQAALWNGMHGVSGFAGWRWLFVINGLMTIVVAAAGYIIIPDSPLDSRAWWIGGQGRKIARRRMLRAGKVVGKSGGIKTLRDWAVLAGELGRGWKLWAFGGAYSLWSFSQNANAWYSLYLKSVALPDGTRRFSVEMVNLIPIPTYVLQGATMVLVSYLSDRSLRRARWIAAMLAVHAVGCVALSIWPRGFAAQMLAFQLLFLSNAGGPIVLAWLADVMRKQPEERTLMVAVMVTVVYAVDCWANLLLWPASEAPRYRFGYQFAAGFAAGAILLAGWIRRNLRQRGLGVEI
ncbi:MFS general substrate transporter [Sphaerosporella brunnea]|uniref:MFS general substrate transporter n=1 Tax=Sphaerosporella brunnea TaxID=1250544 RepID=A0A5J5F531_9PEZI|nr:MFS general substrate transporter [Sphaerosporella brunnea]